MSQYATFAEFTAAGLPPAAVSGIPQAAVEACLVQASGVADSYLRKRYALPLVAPYDSALVRCVIDITVYLVMRRRGIQPESATDVAIRMGYTDALAWLGLVAVGEVEIATAPTGVGPTLGDPLVASRDELGWSEWATGEVI